MLNPHHAMAASFFPSVRYTNRLPLMSQLLQYDISSSSLSLIPSWIYKKHPIFWRSTLVIQLYVKGVYFYSLVTKFNQTYTKYSPKCNQKFL